MTAATHQLFLLVFLCLLGLFGAEHGSEEKSDSHEQDHDHHRAANDSNFTDGGKPKVKWEAYVYGTISVALVSLLSLAGVVVIPFIKRQKLYDGVMLTFMALAVGTMTSDAILHLIPETLGLDKHNHGEHKSGHHDEEKHHNDKAYLGKMVALLGMLYGFYMLELILHMGAKLMRKTRQVHSNDALEAGTIPNGESNLDKGAHKWASEVGHHGGHGHSHGHSSSDNSSGLTILGLKSVAFVVVLSDAMHNFTDGLAIGVAFSRSSAAGLGVTIAVVCHEIPHEIGNFAILLNTGMSFKKALLLNFLSAVTCFAGVYPGILAGEQEAFAGWIFAAVASGFLYVALVHMLRELQHYGSLPWYLSLVLQNVGMLTGFVIIFLLAIYEHDLNGMA